MKAAQVYAAIHGRAFVTPDDIKVLMVPVLAHRLILRTAGSYSLKSDYVRSSGRAADVLMRIAGIIPCPTEPFTEK